MHADAMVVATIIMISIAWLVVVYTSRGRNLYLLPFFSTFYATGLILRVYYTSVETVSINIPFLGPEEIVIVHETWPAFVDSIYTFGWLTAATALFIYAFALKTVLDEVVVYLVLMFPVLVILTTPIGDVAPIASSLILGAPPSVLYIFDRLMRTSPPAVDPVMFLAGHLNFYSATILAVAATLSQGFTRLIFIFIHAFLLTFAISWIIHSIAPYRYHDHASTDHPEKHGPRHPLSVR